MTRFRIPVKAKRPAANLCLYKAVIL